MFKLQSFLVLLFFIVFTISKGQTMSARVERILINDLKSLFESIQDKNSILTSRNNMSLFIYSRGIMKSLKGFELTTNSDSTQIFYTKYIKNKGRITKNHISFYTNHWNTSQYRISQTFSYLTDSTSKYLYKKVLDSSFGDRIGCSCDGSEVFSQALFPGYLEVYFGSVISPYRNLNFFPNGYIRNSTGSFSDPRLVTFEKTIILDSLPTFENYQTINNAIISTEKFEIDRQSNDFSHYELSFFDLVEKEYTEYIKINLEKLVANPDVNVLYRVIDSLRTKKRIELNVKSFSIEVEKNKQLNDDNTKRLNFDIFLNSVSIDRNQELTELSDKLTFWLIEAQLNDIVTPVIGIFDQIKRDLLSTNYYEEVNGNYRIIAQKNEYLQGLWRFSIDYKGCH